MATGDEPKTSRNRRQSVVKKATAAHKSKPESGQPHVTADNPELFFNRELSWLQFNRRVLHEAADSRTPLLERIRFAAISGQNLDEFFMKRIGGLKQQMAAGINLASVDGRTPEQQIRECYAEIRDYQQTRETLLKDLWGCLRAAGISIDKYSDLSPDEKNLLRHDYYENIYPLVTPQSIDSAHPFPFISNLSINLLVTLRYSKDEESSLARVKVPISAGAPRFVQIGKDERFILLEDLMANNLDMLFPGMDVTNCELFRVTRNANVSASEEHADDLLAVIESALRNRKFAPIVRLQIEKGMEPLHRGRLAAELGLDEEQDVFEVESLVGMRDLFELYKLMRPELKYPPHHPVDHPELLTDRNFFHVLRDVRSILVQHPYESFATSVERFLHEAAQDPKVRAIKMTLYRTSPDSRIIDYLISAAHNGKQVAVVVELKARFDEEANIRLANRMEEAGIHVTYGVVGLKTHCKVILVIRQDFKGLRRYVHIGTGNYHPHTARVYSDLGLFAYDKDLGQDATELFNYLTTGYSPSRNYKKILPAPKILKKSLLEKIARETTLHLKQGKGQLLFKMNALEDTDICHALYKASQAGVQVDLIVRDSCRIRPGIEGLSEHIRVISIVGKFLEHSRIFYFRNGGEEEFYIGSADAMRRNLEHRVEVLVPVEDLAIRKEIREMLDIQWQDNRSAWELRSDGSYQQRQTPAGEKEINCQLSLIHLAEKKVREYTRLRKRKTKSFSVRNQLAPLKE